MFWQKQKKLEWSREVRKIGRLHVASVDSEINKLATVVTRYALDLARVQYDFAVRPSTEYRHYRVSGLIVMISFESTTSVQPEDNTEEGDDDDDQDDVRSEYHVNTLNWNCSCSFAMTRLLPCRHMLYLRRLQYPNAMIPISKIHPR